MNCITKYLSKPLEKEECKMYYIDLGLNGTCTLSYSFGKDERDEIEEKLKKEAFDRLIVEIDSQDRQSLNWLDYKRSCINNLFNSKKEAQEKLEKILKILNDEQ